MYNITTYASLNPRLIYDIHCETQNNNNYPNNDLPNCIRFYRRIQPKQNTIILHIICIMRVARLQCVGVKSTKIVLLTRGVYELIDLLWSYMGATLTRKTY